MNMYELSWFSFIQVLIILPNLDSLGSDKTILYCHVPALTTKVTKDNFPSLVHWDCQTILY